MKALNELAKQLVSIFSTFVLEENSLSGYQIILILALLERGVGDEMLLFLTTNTY